MTQKLQAVKAPLGNSEARLLLHTTRPEHSEALQQNPGAHRLVTTMLYKQAYRVLITSLVGHRLAHTDMSITLHTESLIHGVLVRISTQQRQHITVSELRALRAHHMSPSSFSTARVYLHSTQPLQRPCCWMSCCLEDCCVMLSPHVWAITGFRLSAFHCTHGLNRGSF